MKIIKELPEKYIDFFDKRFLEFEENAKTEPERRKRCIEDPVLFAHYYLRTRLRPYQAFVFDSLFGRGPGTGKPTKKLAITMPRQSGKSTLLKILTSWASFHNKFPAGDTKNTRVYLMSRTDDQAKEMLEGIRNVLILADKWRTYHIQGRRPPYFGAKMTRPDNTSQLTWEMPGGIRPFIKSIPPTSKVLGKSACIMIVDEAADLKNPKPDMFFRKDVVPTVAATYAEGAGYLILSSTPNGPAGFFFMAFDPFDKYGTDYKRIWYDYTIFHPDNYWDATYKKQAGLYQEYVMNEKKNYEDAGQLKLWEQEFCSLFNVQTSGFFNHAKVESAVHDLITLCYEYDLPCVLSIDYGQVRSRTVLTITTRMEVGGKKVLVPIYQHEYEQGVDDDLDVVYKDIQELRVRFPKIWKVVVDDCPRGFSINRRLQNDGWDVLMFAFGSLKNRGYYLWRKAINTYNYKMPRINALMEQMKWIVERKERVHTYIECPPGRLMDRADSSMMGAYAYLEEESWNSNSDEDLDKLYGKPKVLEDYHARKDKQVFKTEEDVLKDQEILKEMEEEWRGI